MSRPRRSVRPTPPARRAVLLSALAAAATLSPVPPAQASAPAAPAPRLHFGACPDSVPKPAAPDHVECGRLSVPLDWSAESQGARIDVAVSRVRASGTPAERRGILLVNPGGPGGSGLSYAVTKRAKLPESVRRSFDIIGFDPRGVGRSTPADCGPMGGLFDAPGVDPVPANRAAERAYLTSLHAMADDCATHAAGLLPYLSTEQTAHDMDAIRAALGEPRTSFLGVSYGSYLGAAYAARFPDRVGRMVLDSVVGPWGWYDFDVIQSRALLRQRDTFFAWTAAHAQRFGVGASATAVRRSYLRVRQGLGARPVDGFGPAEFDRAVYRALGRTERWAGLADGIRTYLTSGGVDGMRPASAFDGPDSRNYEAANRIVKCADGPGPSPRAIAADIRRTRRLDPQPVLTGMEASVCASWRHRPGHRTPLGSPDAPPVLLVASAHDPVTPLEGARRLRKLLPGSRLITLDNDYSHGVFASRGNACVDSTAAAYLVAGAVPAADVRCAGPGLPKAP